MPQVTSQNIADYFIALSNEVQDLTTNLKLQKLVYYTQAWHLAAFDEPIFSDEFQAWVHGPVIPSLYHKYKDFGYKPIIEDKPPVNEVRQTLPENVQEILDDVVEEYFGRTAYELEKLTHSEDPWITARGGIPDNEPSHTVISKELMKNYYQPQLLTNNG